MASETAGAQAPVQPDWAPGWRCREHSDRPVELFCRRCSRCVCALCPVLGAHRGHPVGLAQEEAARVQKLIRDCLECLATKKRQQADNIAHLEDAGEKLKVYREQAEACAKQVEVMDDFSTRAWRISQEPNPVQLLQAYIATKAEMGQHMSPWELSHPVPLSFEPVKNFFQQFMEAIQNTLQTPMDTRLKENINCQLSASSTKPGTLLKTSPSPDRSLFMKYARSPTLDPDTMHTRLRLSTDGLSVRCALLGRLGPRPAPRFDALRQVLSRDGFAAGRHYWEVDVQEAGVGWWVGAAYPSLRRHGSSASARLGCNRESWCVKRYDLEYWAFHDCQRSRLWLRRDPHRLGVFLDYEAGVLAFYDVAGGMSHLHTFHAAFQEPLYPALRLWEGAISITRLP
ncbi:tripartite motif-containing protein 14 isoform X2 [Acomys russatus]|uniref:tripartite motif-containing protein 14 isoform X2 n=1 Tax=Acomys russatus TaxID=60746 RepID=UPI0021E320EE|nr:tripartite motif-containing protein 14 isoform X2 [Acomys russatus]